MDAEEAKLFMERFMRSLERDVRMVCEASQSPMIRARHKDQMLLCLNREYYRLTHGYYLVRFGDLEV